MPEELTLKADKLCVHDVEIKSTLIDWIESIINKIKKLSTIFVNLIYTKSIGNRFYAFTES